MGKVLPEWVIYNIIHTHARIAAVGSAEASPVPSQSSCLPCLGPAPSFSREERTNKILSRGRGPAGGWMLRDFLGSVKHCESVFGWVFSLPTPPWFLIWTGFPFLRFIQEKDTRVYNVNCNRLLVYFVILFSNCSFNLQDVTFSDSSDFKSTARICI